MQKSTVMRCEACLLALLLALASGCGDRPAAPELSDSPVYRNSAEGFRFLVPEGWTQTASSTLPPGKLEGEVFLVRYRLQSPEIGATVQVLCMADGAYRNLEQHHAGSSFRVALWDVTQALQKTTINGVPAELIIYKGLVNQREMTKHVTCFRHNGRIYSFVGLCWSTDDQARQQIERASQSVIWES